MRDPWQITREMFLSEQEVAGLLKDLRAKSNDAAIEPRVSAVTDELIVELLLFSGLRNSELCRLVLADTHVSTDEPFLLVREKGENTRNVYLPNWLGEKIRTYVRKWRPLLTRALPVADECSGPLLLNERGKAYERTSLYRRVIRILSGAGLQERASVQLLRHTYGYLAYKQTGGNLLFVQRQLGHAHPMVTAIYAQFVDELPAVAAEQIGSPFRP